jgi:hypothetical protein
VSDSLVREGVMTMALTSNLDSNRSLSDGVWYVFDSQGGFVFPS